MASSAFREGQCDPMFMSYATSIRFPLYSDKDVTPESPLFCPQSRFFTLERSNRCNSASLELVKRLKELSDLATSPSSQPTQGINQHMKGIQNYVNTLPPVNALSEASTETEKQAIWRYEACRLSGVLYTTALVNRRCLSASFDHSELSSILDRLVDAIKRSCCPNSECWGDMTGVLLWVTLVSGVAAQNSDHRRWLRALYVRCFLVLGFEHRSALIVSIRTFLEATSNVSACSGGNERDIHVDAPSETLGATESIRDSPEAFAKTEDSNSSGDRSRATTTSPSNCPSIHEMDTTLGSIPDTVSEFQTEPSTSPDEELREDVVDSAVAKKRQEVVDKLMVLFEEMFMNPSSPCWTLSPETDGSFSALGTPQGSCSNEEDNEGESWMQQETYDAEPAGHRTKDKNRAVEKTFTRGQSSSQKRKRVEEDGTEEHNDDDEDERPNKHRHQVHSEGSKGSKKFACPYSKRNPERPVKATSCFFPGYSTIPRLKYGKLIFF